jgi:hypothetical protein
MDVRVRPSSVDSQHPAYVLDVCYFGIAAGFLYTVSRKYEDAQGADLGRLQRADQPLPGGQLLGLRPG